MTSSTAKLLAEMSDDGRFERLTTAVLREAEARYASLVHSGVNVEGKTIKAPLDGITFVPGAQPAHLIAVHHTTTKASDLRSKWLHDPETVKPRRGNRPTAPAGDLVKTANIVAEERARNPQLAATLVLTTNQEPSVELVRDVHDAAKQHAITIDLWPRSRLAHFLDRPQGQWLRHTFLGIEPEHLSRELLTKLSRDSAGNFKPADDHSDAWVSCSLDSILGDARNDIVFVVAESGFGKSVACYKKLVKHIDRGGYGLFLPHEILETALNLDQAVGLALQQLHPQLAPNAGDEARTLCEGAQSLLIVVEDINRSGRAAQLLERLASWSGPTGTKTEVSGAPTSWQVLCPVWPEVLLSLKDQTRKRVDGLSVTCAPLTTEESRQAVQRRAALDGRIISDMEADAVSNALGHDPLLIALRAPSQTLDAHHVLGDFITSSLSRAASAHPEFTAPDYHSCLLALSEAMLTRRVLEPGWNEITAWFGLSGTVTNILRGLLKHGEVVRLATSAPHARLRFRHDRVRESLLSSGLAAMMRSGTLDETLLSDPFFAEIIGGALTDPSVLLPFVEKLTSDNPLALFYALRRIGSSNAANYSVILKAINSWLDRKEAHDSAHQHLRWQALWVLAQTESPDVVALTKRFQERGWNAWFARLRNGDVLGGVELCEAIEPGSSATWRDVQIDHAKIRYGKNLTSQVAGLLERADLAARSRAGTLRLAGHIADSDLSTAIANSWSGDADRQGHLEDYLWAGAQCCGDDPQRLLGPVCDAWAALPSNDEGSRPSPRDELAAYNAKFAFRRWPPVHALRYLIQRAEGAELNWPIQYLLDEVDHPDAVEFVARAMAETALRAEGSGGFSAFSMMDRWGRDRRGDVGPMSAASKSRLFTLWAAPEADKHSCEQAFGLWAASELEGDLEILRSINHADRLFDKALFQRLKRGDHQAIPDLLRKLRTVREEFWWQAGRYLWSDELTEALDESFVRREKTALRRWDKPWSNADWMTSECLLRLPIDVAEGLLVKHWDHLHYVPNFVQAALYTATPKLQSLVATTMSECPVPKDLMMYIDSHFNLQGRVGSGVTRLAQVESLIPYFSLLSELSIDHFWNHCNKQGWFDFRRQYLDPLLSHPRHSELLGGDGTIKALDDFLKEKRQHWMDHWLDDCIKAGTNLEQIMGELSTWLTSKASVGALRVVSTALVHVGRRSDLPILSSIAIEPGDEADAIIVDTTFAVMRRTLH